MQYDLLQETLSVLIKASEADKLLCEIGNMQDQYWQGRLLTFHSLAFLYYKTGQYKKSLTLLKDGQQIIEANTNSKHSISSDFNLASNLLIFMNLWKAKKYKDSKEYLECSKSLLYSINDLGIKSKISNLSTINLKGLITIAAAGILCYENNTKKAVEICENSLDFLLGEEIIVRSLVYKFLRNIKNFNAFNPDWLLSKEFDGIVLISCFIPYVSSGVPLIKFTKKPENIRPTSRTSSALSSKRVNSTSSRPKLRNPLVKPWWNNPLSENLNFSRRRNSEYGRNTKKLKNLQNSRIEAKPNKSLENSFQNPKKNIYSPSIASTTPRRKIYSPHSATMSELPLQIIKGVYMRPLSSK